MAMLLGCDFRRWPRVLATFKAVGISELSAMEGFCMLAYQTSGFVTRVKYKDLQFEL